MNSKTDFYEEAESAFALAVFSCAVEIGRGVAFIVHDLVFEYASFG
jgi:hypothetical protein